MCASAYGEKGIRVVSLSPGLIATDMGILEAQEGGKMLQFAAEKRMGTPEELGYALDITEQRLHHEIYLCDARKVPPEKWKTVIRHPIRKA